MRPWHSLQQQVTYRSTRESQQLQETWADAHKASLLFMTETDVMFLYGLKSILILMVVCLTGHMFGCVDVEPIWDSAAF